MSVFPVRFPRRHAVAGAVAALLGLVVSLGPVPASAVAGPDSARKHHSKPYPLDNALRMNQIQDMGTHNSYKPGPVPQGLPPSLGAQLPFPLETLRQSLDHRHATLTKQIGQLGVRHVELDVHADPHGGRYVGTPMLAEVGGPTRMKDPDWRKPGLKAFHIGQIDQRTTCVLFTKCLGELAKWSRKNPGHLPFMVLVEIKDTPPAKQWGPADYNTLDHEIRSVLGADKLITPDDVQGRYPTLESAVRANKWPKLADSRGKFMFVSCNCLANDRHRIDYLRPDGSLHGRVMFPTSKPGNPDAAVVLMEEPEKDLARIKELVASGYMVRTRSDANTVEARTGSTARRDAAFASGAQFVSTDYPRADPLINPSFAVQVPDGTPARCNPVNAPSFCQALDIENPRHLKRYR
ncbi:Ca2+-dependent phosphoinositide-specific phospholipase C [Streptomyces sp. NPDC050504]|uniref:Ca2+-dependent phosphoinositide-specific phospholipase C n=1 Tax=Streptomyces sp. NPDC050504 TaxID=3365618 RepID=UPI003791EEEF